MTSPMSGKKNQRGFSPASSASSSAAAMPSTVCASALASRLKYRMRNVVA